MLSPDQMKALAFNELDRMKRRLGIAGVETVTLWNQDLHRGRTSDGWPTRTRGEVHVDPLYNRLTIRLDPSHHADRAQALETIRHELLHWFQRHFDLHHARVMQAVSEDAAASIEESMSQARELFVLDLERMLDAAGLTPEALAAPFAPAPTPAPKPKAAKQRPPKAAPAATRST